MCAAAGWRAVGQPNAACWVQLWHSSGHVWPFVPWSPLQPLTHTLNLKLVRGSLSSSSHLWPGCHTMTGAASHFQPPSSGREPTTRSAWPGLRARQGGDTRQGCMRVGVDEFNVQGVRWPWGQKERGGNLSARQLCRCCAPCVPALTGKHGQAVDLQGSGSHHTAGRSEATSSLLSCRHRTAHVSRAWTRTMSEHVLHWTDHMPLSTWLTWCGTLAQ